MDNTLIVDDREQARGYSRARDEGEGDDAQQRRGVVDRRLREVGRERKCELGHIMDVAVNGEDKMRDARRSKGRRRGGDVTDRGPGCWAAKLRWTYNTKEWQANGQRGREGALISPGSRGHTNVQARIRDGASRWQNCSP